MAKKNKDYVHPNKVGGVGSPVTVKMKKVDGEGSLQVQGVISRMGPYPHITVTVKDENHPEYDGDILATAKDVTIIK